MLRNSLRSGSLLLAAFLAIQLLWVVTDGHCEARAEIESRVLVEVGADRFTVADFQLYLQQVSPLVDFAKLPPGERQRRLEEFVDKKLFALESRRAGLDQSPELRARIDFFVDSVLAQAFKDRLLSEIEVSSEELDGFYREHRERFRTPARAHLEHYLYDHREKASKARERLRDGMGFDQLAEEKERDRSVLLVERGWFTAEILIPEVAESAFLVPVGGVSEVIQSSYGYHVLKVRDREASRIQSFPAVRSEVSEMVRQSKAARVLREALEGAKRHHEVFVHAGRLQ